MLLIFPIWGFKREATVVEKPFHKQYYWQFHGLSRSTLNKFIAAIRGPKKYKKVF